MHAASLRTLADHEILAGIVGTCQSLRTRTAEFLRYLAELDRRGLYRDAGYPSAHQFCVSHMRLSEDQAYKHLRTARAGRRFPIVFDLIADGRTNVSAIKLLAPHLTRVNGEALLHEAVGMTNEQVRRLLAERFPQSDVPTVMFALAKRVAAPMQSVSESSCELAVRPVEGCNALRDRDRSQPPAEETLSITPVPAITYERVTPLSPASYALQCTLSAAAHAKLREVQDLLGPRVPSSEISRVLELALDALLIQLARTRRAAISKPEPDSQAPPLGDAGSQNPRHIPASLRRAVWARDAGTCQFVSATGHRCDSRSGLEFDHVRPVSLGGTSELASLRLLCRAHNQLEAERRMGQGFMRAHRERLRRVVPTP